MSRAKDRDRFISTFEAHGFEMTSRSGDEAVGTCPLTGKRGKFHINSSKKVWHSKTAGVGGTVATFLDLIQKNYVSNLTEALLQKLADDRGLSISALRPWGFGWDGRSYTLAVRDRSGAVVDIRSYRLTRGTRRMMSTPGCHVGLLGAHLLDRDPSAPVHLAEGEADLIALAWLLNRLGEPGVVVAVPGAGTFKTEWAEWLTGRTIHTYYDCDEAGYSSAEELTQRNLEQGDFEPDYPRLQFKELMQRQGYVKGLESVWKRRDGTTISVRESARSIRDTQGNSIYFEGTVEDITERRRAEDERRGMTTRLALLLDNITDGFFTLDRELRYTDINISGATMVGRTPEQLIGRLLLDEFPQAADTPFVRAYRRVSETGEACVVEDYYAPLDRWFEARAYPSPAGVSVFFSDISARKRGERALKEREETLRVSESRLRQAQQIARIGNWELDLATSHLWWSEEMFRVFELDPTEFGASYEAFLSAIHPDDRDRVNAAYTGSLEKRTPYEITHRLLMADGRIKFVEERCETDYASDGTPLRSRGTMQDVTERRRAEEALRESEETYRSILNASPDDITITDLAGRIIMTSPAANKMFGYEPGEEERGLQILDFLVPEDVERARANIRLMYQGSYRGPHEYRGVRKDRSTFDIEINSGFIRGAHGQPIKMVVIVRDITQRRQADEARRLQSAALHAAADAIVITDRAGVIEWINPAFTQLTGYTAEEALGKHHRDLVKSGQQARAFYQELWEAILAGRTWRGEVINRRKDGSLYTEEQVVTPILNAAGVITHFVAIQQDITEQLQLKAQFHQAQKMESVGQLASGIAHDFNNLLTVINGMSGLVLAQISHDDPVHADVQEILDAGERAALLTRQLLAFSRRQILESRVLNLNTVVAEMESLLRRVLGEDIDLVVALTPGSVTVQVDPGQIEQVITNLVVNARDAMPQGGRLTIETRRVTTDKDSARQLGLTMPPGSYVLLTVSDSGTGMDAATRTRIFEPFFTTKGPGHGTGLGLSTVYGIVTQSHGFITVDSEVGHGTRFKIYLPQVTEAAGTDRPEPTVVSRAGTETILLAEDNAELRKLATRMLAPAGYTVLGAATGEEALRVLERHEAPVHLLLTDVVMPGMSGRQLAEQIAQTHPGTKVLYMSGYTDDIILRHGVLEAQVPFLNKPFTAAALLRKVREVLDSSA